MRARPASIAAAAMLVGMPAHAQDRTADVDRVFGAATQETPGCAVGVSQNGTVIVHRAYGLADVERRVPLSERSRFDIGSAQKQFTAAAVLLLVEDGRLRLSDDIRTHIPELPDYGHTVTVNHLLTHTGGIRDWPALMELAGDSVGVLQVLLRQRGLNFVPGEEWAYSSGGYELAKEIVARASGMSFAEFTRRRLFEPLGMTSSAYVPDILHAGPDAALGYLREGAGWKRHMRLGNDRGGGAVVATVGDLLRWNDALTSGRLGAFVTAKLQEQATLHNGRTLRYGRGLNVDHTPGGTVVSHSGDAYGFSAWMGRFPDPEHGLSVAVTCNFNPVSATALGTRVADLFLPPLDPQAPQPPRPVAVPGVDPTGRAGVFLDERTGAPLTLVVGNGRLGLPGGLWLVPVGQDRFRVARGNLFVMSQDEFELHFPSPDRLELTSMEGQMTRYRRAQPHAHTAAELQAFHGRYHSAEVALEFEVAPGPNGLVMRLQRSPGQTIELTPVERDTWSRGGSRIVRFLRDGRGEVVGLLDHGDPSVRNVRFTRVGDGAARNALVVPVTKDPPAAAPAVPRVPPVR